MEEVIVIRAQDPDGSVFQAVMDSLKGKRAEVVDVAAPATSVLRIGELEIHHKHRRVLMAGREVELNHGEYAMLYFGKEPADMTDDEATLLAGIPNAPSVYSLTANPDLAAQRQQYVLQQMVKYGYLGEEEAAAILQN